jgi:septal ring factor EnvC (AmiA/AmiB activator)
MRPDLRADLDFRPKLEHLRTEREGVERNHKADRAGRSRRAPGRPPAAGPGYPTNECIVASFGESREGSGASRGITWETMSAARVVALAAGAFADPFRGYGLLLIAEHLGGYYSLLAGLGASTSGSESICDPEIRSAMGHRGTGNLSLYMSCARMGIRSTPCRGSRRANER